MKIISVRGRQKTGMNIIGLKAEWARCSADPAYFMRTYVYMPVGSNGFTFFKPWQCQEDFIDNIEKDGMVVLAHCRAAGITTTMMAYLLWRAIFHAGEKIVVLVPKHAQLRSMMALFAAMHDNLDTWIKPAVNYSTARHTEFANGTNIYFHVASSHITTGMSINTLYLADFAHVAEDEQMGVLVAAAPLMVQGGKIIATSTPNARGDVFQDMWENISIGAVPGIAQRITYYDLPHATVAGWAQLLSVLGDDTANREYGAQFV